MKTVFKTNLDVAQPFLHQLAECDGSSFAVGDFVEFYKNLGTDTKPDIRCFQLAVVARMHDLRAGRLVIELHMPRYDTRSIREWMEWFERHMLGRDW